MHEGHRQRMLERLENAEESLCDHELLEILLFNAIPRKNTNEIAHQLLSSFGSLNGVFRASMSQLCAVEGVGQSTAAYLKCIGSLLKRCDPFDTTEAVSLRSFDQFSKFLTDRFEGLETEIVELYSLDANERVKAIRRYTSKDQDRVQIKAEEIVDFILKEKPNMVLIVHNHVKGDCSPSVADNEFTATVYMICSIYKVKLREHVILSKDGLYSYYLTGNIDRLARQYDMGMLLKEGKI